VCPAVGCPLDGRVRARAGDAHTEPRGLGNQTQAFRAHRPTRFFAFDFELQARAAYTAERLDRGHCDSVRRRSRAVLFCIVLLTGNLFLFPRRGTALMGHPFGASAPCILVRAWTVRAGNACCFEVDSARQIRGRRGDWHASSQRLVCETRDTSASPNV